MHKLGSADRPGRCCTPAKFRRCNMYSSMLCESTPARMKTGWSWACRQATWALAILCFSGPALSQEKDESIWVDTGPVYGLYEMGNTLWIGTVNGLYRWDKSSPDPPK